MRWTTRRIRPLTRVAAGAFVWSVVAGYLVVLLLIAALSAAAGHTAQVSVTRWLGFAASPLQTSAVPASAQRQDDRS